MLFDLKNEDEKKFIKEMITEYQTGIRPSLTLQLQNNFEKSEKRPILEQTKSILFSKSEMEEFFLKNPDSNSFRVYFAIHKESSLNNKENGFDYQGQLTVVLIPALTEYKESEPINSVDLVNGTALDWGGLCPPNCIGVNDSIIDNLF